MKNLLLITAMAFILTGCTNWESRALDAPHEIVQQDDSSATIVYQNDYGIGFNDPDVNLPDDQEADYNLLYEYFFNESSRRTSKQICLNESSPQLIPLVTWHVKCPAFSTGCGGASREAFICGEKYAIGTFDLADGPAYYGPYDLETHEFIELNVDSTKNPS